MTLVTLFLVFLVLKLTSVIGWSWFWVFLPLGVHAAIWAIAVVITLTTKSRFERRFMAEFRRGKDGWP